MRTWRGYDPRNDKLIEKAVNYAKTVILDYHTEMGAGHTQEIRVFVDERRAKATGELNRAYELMKNYKPMEMIEDGEWKFVDDRIMSALAVYVRHVRMESAEIQDLDLLQPIQEELNKIDKLIEYRDEDSNNGIYLSMFEEIKIYYDNL